MSDNLHAKIMNLPVDIPSVATFQNEVAMYKYGHRDARHAAAELANEADETISTLRTALQTHAEEAARLMEQKDELLAALIELERVYEHWDFESEFRPALEQARAAISNATNTTNERK